MQRLVYIFIVLTGLGLAVATYGALAFSAVESATVAMSLVAVAMTLTERSQRRRAEARLDQSIQSLARLLATDAKARLRVEKMAGANGTMWGYASSGGRLVPPCAGIFKFSNESRYPLFPITR